MPGLSTGGYRKLVWTPLCMELTQENQGVLDLSPDQESTRSPTSAGSHKTGEYGALSGHRSGRRPGVVRADGGVKACWATGRFGAHCCRSGEYL